LRGGNVALLVSHRTDQRAAEERSDRAVLVAAQLLPRFEKFAESVTQVSLPAGRWVYPTIDASNLLEVVANQHRLLTHITNAVNDELLPQIEQLLPQLTPIPGRAAIALAEAIGLLADIREDLRRYEQARSSTATSDMDDVTAATHRRDWIRHLGLRMITCAKLLQHVSREMTAEVTRVSATRSVRSL
jgi:hypothetical protein